ncbi:MULTISPECIES: hypothetical protein [unclassified Caballeronia]|uniref:hypothetical protein n=1 Tax=unclassified Caballeronia TaxID=2646786 RepID=UPI00286474AF|nr:MULTISPECIES: hypothetical protein [unclassified Caballeronia]MDR5776558.1 hypothetical protein [Caballeronia sp. LZ002]MDR5851991.1 hypothetical protein [Caballeronia sp. LZ003]
MSANDVSTSQQTVLVRMAATRAELIAANHISSSIAEARRGERARPVQQGPVILQWPYAQLISVVLVATVVLGPKHVVKSLFGRILIPWMTHSLRNMFRR